MAWGCQPKLQKSPDAWLGPVLRHVVYPKLNPSSEAFLATFMPGISPTDPLVSILAELGFTNYLDVTPAGLELKVVDFFRRWREDDNLSIYLDACFLAEIHPNVMKEDVRLLWNITSTAEDLAVYADLFIDRELLRYGWVGYEQAYDRMRAGFVRSLMRQPHDYVRWKLGIPVSLDTTMVLDRLISEAYYTERSIKNEQGNGALAKDSMSRMKMERDTLFKAIDRRLKLQEAKAGGGNGQEVADKAMAVLEQLTLKYEQNDFPTIEALTGHSAQSYSEPPRAEHAVPQPSAPVAPAAP